jgi:osmoprotectant transport system ATP-binding protein
VIEFENVSKTFRDGTTAVSDLSLTAPSGKITVIVGPSGCGKTTTLRMVNRMLEPTKGRILWDGTPLRSKRKTTLRRQMGYVIQSGGLFPHRTVLENIGTVPGLLHWDKAKIRKRSYELLKSVGLDSKLAHRYPAQLSGGQQQRVGVARALAADPLVMLMDEPFSAVDPVVRGELQEFFLGLQRQLSKTIIFITHDIDEAIKLGDQVAILRVGGRLAQTGAPQQLLNQPADDFVEGFIGRDRGYRSLSFLPAAGLSLGTVKVVRDPQSAPAENCLVIDPEARPTGWVDRTRPGKVLPLGSTFDAEADTLRTALDAALTSPVGLAVAVSRTSGGRFVGVVSAREILAQVVKAKVEPEAVRIGDARPTSSGGDTAADKVAPSRSDDTARASVEADASDAVGAVASEPAATATAESNPEGKEAAEQEATEHSAAAEQEASERLAAAEQEARDHPGAVEPAAPDHPAAAEPAGEEQAAAKEGAGEVRAAVDSDATAQSDQQDSTPEPIIVAGVPVDEAPAALDEASIADAATDDADQGEESADPAYVAAASRPTDGQATGNPAKPRREATDDEAGAPAAEPQGADWSGITIR